MDRPTHSSFTQSKARDSGPVQPSDGGADAVSQDVAAVSQELAVANLPPAPHGGQESTLAPQMNSGSPLSTPDDEENERQIIRALLIDSEKRLKIREASIAAKERQLEELKYQIWCYERLGEALMSMAERTIRNGKTIGVSRLVKQAMEAQAVSLGILDHLENDVSWQSQVDKENAQEDHTVQAGDPSVPVFGNPANMECAQADKHSDTLQAPNELESAEVQSQADAVKRLADSRDNIHSNDGNIKDCTDQPEAIESSNDLNMD